MNPDDVAERLGGAVVEHLGRFGKYMDWALSGDRHLLIHLRMTGALLFDPAVDPQHTARAVRARRRASARLHRPAAIRHRSPGEQRR